MASPIAPRSDIKTNVSSNELQDKNLDLVILLPFAVVQKFIVSASPDEIHFTTDLNGQKLQVTLRQPNPALVLTAYREYLLTTPTDRTAFVPIPFNSADFILQKQAVMFQSDHQAPHATYELAPKSNDIDLPFRMIEIEVVQNVQVDCETILQNLWGVSLSVALAIASRGKMTVPPNTDSTFVPNGSSVRNISYYTKPPLGNTPIRVPATMMEQSPSVYGSIIDVDTPPPAKPASTGPLNLPIPKTSNFGGGGFNTPTTSGSRTNAGGLETVGSTRPAVVVTPVVTPVTPTARPSASSTANTDSVGVAIYRFGTAVPVTVVESLQNQAPVVQPVPFPQPYTNPVFEIFTQAHAMTLVSSQMFANAPPPAPPPAPPQPLGYDSENNVVNLPSADTTEYFDAPGVSAEIMMDPKLHPEDGVIDAPGADAVDGVVGDAPVPLDSEIWLQNRRPYQQQAISRVLTRQQNGLGRHLLIFPTGTGKTFMATETAFELHQMPEFAQGRIIIIAPTAEIANQNALGMSRRFGGQVGVLHSEGKPNDPAYAEIEFVAGEDPGTLVVSATIQSLAAQGDDFDWSDFTIVMADEAHHYVPDNNTYFAPFVNFGFFTNNGDYANPHNKVLVGFTATPDRMNPQPGNRLLDVYGVEGIADTLDINYFTSGKAEEQYLRNPHRIVRVAAHDASGNTVLQREAWLKMDYADRAALIAELFTDHPDLNRDGSPKRSILYLSSVEEARALEFELASYGLNVISVTGDDKDRTQRLQDFRNGKYDILIGVNVPKEGFDVPGVEAVLLFGDDTESRSQVVQMVGRALRMDPKNPDRTAAYIVDPWGLTERHHVQMAGETTYFQEAKNKNGRSGEVEENSEPKPTAEAAHSNTEFMWENVNLGSLIANQTNSFQAVLQSLYANEEEITRAAYAAGVSADALRRLWLGQDVPATLAQAQEWETQLGIADQGLTVAYQETTGMAIRTYLLQRLREKMAEIGKVPLMTDMGGDYPSGNSYFKYFGSWTGALVAAGLMEKPVELTRDLAIANLKEWAKTLGAGENLTLVKYNAWAAANDKPKHTSIANIITGDRYDWTGALKAAELSVELTRDLAITYLKEWAKTLSTGEKLTTAKYNAWAEVNGKPKYNSISNSITDNPKDWQGALKAAGLSVKLTRDMAIACLKECAKTLGANENLTAEKYDAWAAANGKPKYNSIANIITGDKSNWTGALKAAGFSVELTRDLAIVYLKEWAKTLGAGESLTKDKYNAWAESNGKPKHTSIAKIITGDPKDWTGALKAAGLK